MSSSRLQPCWEFLNWIWYENDHDTEIYLCIHTYICIHPRGQSYLGSIAIDETTLHYAYLSLAILGIESAVVDMTRRNIKDNASNSVGWGKGCSSIRDMI